jgi:hypothetical protein
MCSTWPNQFNLCFFIKPNYILSLPYILVDKIDVSLDVCYCLPECTQHPTVLAIPCTSLIPSRCTKPRCVCVPLLRAVTGVHNCVAQGGLSHARVHIL